MKRFLFAIVISSFGLATFSAADEVELIPLKVSPAGRPTPALKYRLLPGTRTLKAGNAASLYYRAAVLLKEPGYLDARKKIFELYELPIEGFPYDEAKKALEHFRGPLHEAALGARRDRAEWDLPLRDNGISTTLMEMQETRQIARLLDLQTRLALHEGNYEVAAESLQTLIAMGRHVSQSGTLVSSLIGAACIGMALNEVTHWIGQPDSPNLYWALTALPETLVDMQAALETEQIWLEASLPYLDILERSILSEDQAGEVAKALGKLIDETAENGGTRFDPPFGLKGAATLMFPALSSYSRLKQEMIAAGRQPKDVERMPVAQVLALRWVQTYRESLDQSIAWAGRPYLESEPMLRQIERDLPSTRPAAFLANLLLPGANAAVSAELRLEQRVATLRVVEALRLYAAENKGRLPARLLHVLEVPVPVDPVTNGPFPYELRDDTAIIRPAPLRQELKYEITVRQ